jgi:hypothetical protein
MTYKDIFVFILVCILSGVCIFAFSVLGNGLLKTGVFIGAVVGGFVGVMLGVWLSKRFGLFGEKRTFGALIGGFIGFIIAAWIAVTNLETFIVPVAAIALIGAGAVLGKYFTPKVDGNNL